MSSYNEKYVPAKIIPAVSYLLTKSDVNKSKLENMKNLIIEHNSVWGNGLHDNAASPASFIEISKVEENISWDQEDLFRLYDKLVVSYRTLKQSPFFKNDDDDFFTLDYKSLLNEMVIFLEKYATELRGVEGAKELSGEISKELYDRRKYVNIEEGLYSLERSSVILAINELVDRVNKNGINDYIKHIDILLNRIILQNKVALFECINIAFYCVIKYKNELLTDELIRQIILILDKYKGDVCLSLNIDKVKVYSTFIQIAECLKTRGVCNEAINYWTKQKKIYFYLEHS